MSTSILLNSQDFLVLPGRLSREGIVILMINCIKGRAKFIALPRLSDMMKLKTLYVFAFFLFPVIHTSAQFHGLEFSSYEVTLEKRTGLNLNPEEELCFKNKFELSFDLNFLVNRPTSFGYLFRIINSHQQNIDLIYDQRDKTFNVIAGESFTGINFKIADSVLVKNYLHFTLRIENDKILLFLSDKLLGTSVCNLKDHCFNIFFGACSLRDLRTMDVPPMRIRDIRINIDNTDKYYWPLNESAGTVVKDSAGKITGRVLNPNWILPMHQKWQLNQSFSVKGNASIAFDNRNEILYIVANDSIYTYSVKDKLLTGTALQSNSHHLLLGNQSIFHTGEGKLYNYFVDKGWITSYDVKDRKWTNPFDSADVTEYWQANRFISTDQNALYVIGGYGQLKYKNDIQKYDFTSNKWSRVKFKGDSLFTPRYLASLATTDSNNIVYLLGGYGSSNGSQMLTPHYHYDLMMLDVQKGEMKKIYSLKEPKEHFLFANSFIINSQDSTYYALIFPNDRAESNLHLIKGSLRSPDYVFAADSIPYLFGDTHSYADLFLCKENGELLTVTQFTENNKKTNIKIHSIAFPPNVLPETSEAKATIGIAKTIYWVIGILLIAIIFILLIRKGRRQLSQKSAELNSLENNKKESGKLSPLTANQENVLLHVPEPVHPIEQQSVKPEVVFGAKSAIILFGNFEVNDIRGNNLTHLFTPLLKELFLLITLYTIKQGQGISSEKLNAILWNDKPTKDAKNNRSVNMVKLKNILEQLGDCKVIKRGEKWVLEYNQDQIHVDLSSLLALIAKKESFTKQEIILLIAIVQRGALLNQTEYEWLDDFKSDISNKVIDALLKASSVLNEKSDPELLIEIANCIFQFDQINEQAIKIKCKCLIALGRHSLARNCYEKFAKEYSQMYGEDFQESYNGIIS